MLFSIVLRDICYTQNDFQKHYRKYDEYLILPDTTKWYGTKSIAGRGLAKDGDNVELDLRRSE